MAILTKALVLSSGLALFTVPAAQALSCDFYQVCDCVTSPCPCYGDALIRGRG